MSELGGMVANFQTHIQQTLNDSGFQKSVAEIIRSSIDRNFKEGGRYGNGKFGGGSNKWMKSWRSEEQNGQPLSDTGELLATTLASVKVSSDGRGIIIEAGSNKPYAAIHQFGGKIPITAKLRAFFRFKAKSAKNNKWFSLFKSAMDKEAFNMPARPYLVLQDEDVEDILNAFGRRFGI